MWGLSISIQIIYEINYRFIIFYNKVLLIEKQLQTSENDA